MSKRQLQNVLVIIQLCSKNYCTPNTTDGTAKTWGLVDLGFTQGRDSPGWRPKGQCCVRMASRDNARCELPWEIIYITVALPDLIEDQSPLKEELYWGFPAWWGGLVGSSPGTPGDLLRCTEAEESQD